MEYCNKCGWIKPQCQCEEPMTNGDKIRSMSDKELAKWLTGITNDAQSDAKTKFDYQWLEWLQTEVKE